ncbi:50S ribosomal protein L1, partial [bacterium]|nr:50S ribosomal protein L1 [bacterium]
SKRYKSLILKIDKAKSYPLPEAVDLLLTMTNAKMDETIEVHLSTRVDKLTGSVNLPYGTGKKQKVVIVDDKVIDNISNGRIDFDILIAAPSFMPKLARLARILGPKGLMPNPKTGTVTPDVATAVANVKGGQVAFRVDKKGNIHAGIGKVSFEADKIAENLSAFVGAINKHKPATAKGRYIKNAALSLTMSPAVKLDIAALLDIR